MIIDGETYACEGCIRGHRTRNCQHNDRPLQHIKSKGRPVSQCNHCRSERKNRSAHVKCQCGKRASEGGSDCGCFSGQKCRCATKKSPKQEAKNLGDISETISELASPASTFNTASPAPPSIAADFQWSDASTPASNFTSIDGLAQFDPHAWLNNPLLDPAFDAGTLDPSTFTTIPTTGGETDLLPTNAQPQFSMDLPDFTSMSDWPAMDDDASKQLLAMMDGSTGIDMGGFDASAFDAVANKPESNFGLDFSSIDLQQMPEEASTNTDSKCSSKPEKGCGPCCG